MTTFVLCGCANQFQVSEKERLAQEIRQSNVHLISPQALRKKLDEGSVFLVDVRRQDEYQQAHIPGSILRPLGEETEGSFLTKNKPVVFYCHSGKRSLYAAEMALNSSYRKIKVYSLEGGILAWKKAGFKVLP